MKQLVSLTLGCLIVIANYAQSQPKTVALPVAMDKTTSLIFPFAVRYVDRGSENVVVQQVNDAENLLLIKAAVPGFPETNLSVVTADGQVYCFNVTYQQQVPWTVYQLQRIDGDSILRISFSEELMNKRDLENYTTGILDNPRFLHRITDKKWDVSAEITGIYIKDNVIFYQLVLGNYSSISYDIDYIRFYIRDKKKSRRTAWQEVELRPIYKTGNTSIIPPYSYNISAFALQKFTIPDDKFFYIEIGEKNGGRNMRLRITNTKLLQARTLPSYH